MTITFASCALAAAAKTAETTTTNQTAIAFLTLFPLLARRLDTTTNFAHMRFKAIHAAQF
jgi:hypothetical protein